MLRPDIIVGVGGSAAVYNNMGDDTCTSTTSNLASPCFGSWSWDVTKCTDMLPFSVESRVIRGTFMQVSSAAMALEARVGAITIRAIDVMTFDEAGKFTSMKAYFGPEDVSQD